MIFSVDKHILSFFFFVMLFPNQLHNTWFWPQAAFAATKHQLTVHQPLLQCAVSWCCLLGQPEQALPELPGEAASALHPLSHHAVAAVSFQPPVR